MKITINIECEKRTCGNCSFLQQTMLSLDYYCALFDDPDFYERKPLLTKNGKPMRCLQCLAATNQG